jgi:histidine triad (HIT) family protein
VFQTTARIARAVKNAYAPEGVTLYQANGAAAGQTVFHFHLHIVPRHSGDGMRLTWPTKNPPREQLEESAARIRNSLT